MIFGASISLDFQKDVDVSRLDMGGGVGGDLPNVIILQKNKQNVQLSYLIIQQFSLVVCLISPYNKLRNYKGLLIIFIELYNYFKYEV
jgi:hypothetical protein